MINFNVYESFRKFENPIDFGEYEAIGYFSYALASVYSKTEKGMLSLPRGLFRHIEEQLKMENFNKYVVIFKTKERTTKDDFAIYFKDLYCKIGHWEDVQGYGNQSLI